MLRTDDVRQQLGATPSGDEAQHGLGQAQGRNIVRDGAVVRVQTHFESAAERETVHERERRDRRLAQLTEHVVAECAEFDALRVLGDCGDTLEIGAGSEDERLAGDGDSCGVRGERLVEGSVERGQAGGSERVRLGVVEPVVEGDQGDLSVEAGDGHEPGVGVRHDLVGEQGRKIGHDYLSPSKFGFSQMTVPPMPRPMHMVVRP